LKFLVFTMYEPRRAVELAKVSDQFQDDPPEGYKTIAMYTCQGIPFPQGLPEGVSPDTMVSVSIHETETNEALSAGMYPFILAGAAQWAIPILELDAGNVATQEKRLRG
jgi:hypothetical protein